MTALRVEEVRDDRLSGFSNAVDYRVVDQAGKCLVYVYPPHFDLQDWVLAPTEPTLTLTQLREIVRLVEGRP